MTNRVNALVRIKIGMDRANKRGDGAKLVKLAHAWSKLRLTLSVEEYSEYLKRILMVIAMVLMASNGWTAEPNYEHLADAIRRAEGNSNYGILTHYKHTSYRQACINTCRHAHLDWINVRPGASNAKVGYLQFLANRYCPIGAKNDPTNLNKNWLSNVTHYYREIR